MSFIDRYVEYSSKTEAHENFNLFTAYGVVSSLLGGRVWVEATNELIVYPNLFIVYVADPGSRKSTAMRNGHRLLRAAVGNKIIHRDKNKIPLIPFAATASSAMQFIKNMESGWRPVTFGKDIPDRAISPMTVCASELSSFLLVSNDLIAVLTDLYDEADKFEYHTGSAGNVTIPGPYLTILGCCTPAWITSQLKSDIISGGFSRRALFVYENTFRRQSLRVRTDNELYRALVTEAQSILEMRGPFTWDNEAFEWFDAWYLDTTRDKDLQEDPTTSGYANSKHIQLLKLAICVAAAHRDRTIRLPYLKSALADLERIEPNISRVFRGMGRNSSAPLFESIMDFIETKGGFATEQELTGRFMKEAQRNELTDILIQLETAGKIQFGSTKTTREVFGVVEEVKVHLFALPTWFDEYAKSKGIVLSKYTK